MGFFRFVPVLAGCVLIACSATEVGKNSLNATAGDGSEVALEGESKLFPGFAYDTGLQPESGPAQASFAFKIDGALKLKAAGAKGEGALEGKAASGKLTIDLHAKMEGNLKVDAGFKKYDGAIPGLDNIDIAAVGDSAFDPFLLEEGQEAETIANVPETKLPSIPLGSVPGSLELTVKAGSTVKAKLHGTCLRGGAKGTTYETETITSGKLVLQAVLKLDLPMPLNKEIALPDITVDLPETKGTIEAESATSTDELELGACAGSAKSDNGGSSSSSGGTDNSTSSTSSSGGGSTSSSSSSSGGGSSSSSGSSTSSSGSTSSSSSGGTSTSSSSSGGTTTDPLATCSDTSDPGATAATGRALPQTDDCDNDFKSVSGVSRGKADVDVYKLSALDEGVSFSHPVGCALNTDFEAQTAGTELCVAMTCKGSTTSAITGCAAGTLRNGPAGKACCASAPGHAIPQWDCSGFTDNDSADIVMTVSQPTANACLPYTFRYKF